MKFDQNTAGYGWMDFLQMIRTRWSLIVLTSSVCLLSGAGLKTKVPYLYEYAVRIELNAPEEWGGYSLSLTDFQATSLEQLPRFAAELKSRELLSEVIVSQGLVERWKSASENEALQLLAERVRVERRPEENSLVLVCRDVSIEGSISMAKDLAGRFVARREAEDRTVAKARVERFENDLRERKKIIDGLEDRLREISGNPGSSPVESRDLRSRLVDERYILQSLEAKQQLSVIEALDVKSQLHVVDGDQPVRTVASIPFLFGLPVLLTLVLGAGIGLAAFVDRGRTRWNHLTNLINHLQVKIVGLAPLSGVSLFRSSEGSAPLLEAYRDLRAKLLRLPVGDCHLISFMPLRGRDGFAEVITNFACVIADGGKMVLVIDADFRQPRLHRFMDAANHPGLSDFLSGEMRMEETVIKGRRPNLWFMPSGPVHDDPCGLIEGRRMGDLVWEMRRRFDFILVASPSIDEVSDAGAIVKFSDYTALVTPYGKSSVSHLGRARELIEAASGRLFVVLLSTLIESGTSRRPAQLDQAGRLESVLPAAVTKGSK